jgi:hypothetical protein
MRPGAVWQDGTVTRAGDTFVNGNPEVAWEGT